MTDQIPVEIQKIIDMIPFLREAFGEEVGLFVSDTQRYLVSLDGSVKLEIKELAPIKRGSIADTTLREKRKLSKRVSKEVYGAPYVGIGIPIFAGGEIVGTFATTNPIDRQENIHNISVEMLDSVNSIVQGTSNLAASAQQLAASSAELARNAGSIEDEIKNMDNIMELIKEIASQTHLLGLNAAIEAARAGDMGRGFNVVAEEIRKLASNTQLSAKEVSEKLESIKNRINSFSENILQISAVAEEQAATTQSISDAVQKFEPVSKQLNEIAESLLS